MTQLGYGGLSHLDEKGNAHMVDVSAKPETRREATASARVVMAPETLQLITSGDVPKGDVFATARLAGIMAAKRTGDLIPLCHPLSLEAVDVSFQVREPNEVIVTGRAVLTGRTGVEMEALTAVSVAALTIYDMCKAVDRSMVVTDVRLEEKLGGRSGHYKRSNDDHPTQETGGSDEN